jgi:hypothetical protein
MASLRGVEIFMIQIRFSDGELEISGSPQVLRQVSQSMLDLIHDQARIMVSIEAETIDPSPYAFCLSQLSIVKTTGLIKLSVAANALQIEGAPERLEVFAKWFAFDDSTHSGYHHHFEYLGLDKDPVDPDSIPLVITARH